MTVIGSASINIRADDKYFEPDVRRAVAKIKDLRVALKVDADMSAANKKLRDLRYRLSNQEVSIKIRANDVAFEADVRAAVRKIKNVSIDLKADVDSSKASKKIRDLRYRITSKDAILKVDANVAKAEEKMRKLLEKFTESTVNITAKAHTGAAHTALSDLQTRYGKNVNFTATADTKVARAALALVARNRRAKITAFIDPTTAKGIQGLFNTITGTLPFDKIKSSIVGVVANFEMLAVKATAVGAALLSVGALALTAGANIFSIAGDITQVIGISAMLPAAFIAMGTAIATTKMAWKGFGEALSSDPKKAAKAMAELPPEAQKAADSVRGLGTEIQKATQAKFWEALGTSLQDMVTNLLPQAKEGFEYVGTAIGTLQAATFDNISKGLGDGVLLGIMTNIGDMFTNMTKGVGDFTQGFITLGRVGSTYLPQLGTSLSDAGTKFGEFIRKADEAGKINDWIDTSIQRFQELGSIVKSTVGIMSGLTEIARLSGAPGLTEMAAGFRNIADVVNSEPFQSQLRTILEGARAGTEALGEGLSTLTQLFWNSSESIGAFLKLAGEIAGLTFENITKLFDGTGLGTGLFEALQGFKDGMGELGPAFRDMGTAVGDLGRIAGELFRSMAPSLNMLAETIAGVVGGLADGIIAAMPIFNEFAQAILNLASGPLIALAQGIGNILTAFSALPGAVQTVIMSLGLLLLLAPKFTKFFGGMAANLAKETSTVGNHFRDMRDNATTTMRGVTTATEGTGTAMRRVFTDSGTAATSMFGTMRKEAGTAADKMTSSIATAAAATSAALKPVGTGFKQALMVDGDLDRVSGKLTETSGRVSAFAKEQGGLVKDQFSQMATYSSGRMDEIGNSAKTAFGKISGFATEQVGLAKNQFADMGRAVDHSLAYIPSRAATAFGGMATNAADAARGTVGAFKDTGDQIGRGLSTINGHVRRVAGQIGTDLAPARAAFSDLVTHAGTAGKAAGASLGSGIKTAAAGISGALGGGWGLALAGATVALGAYAQAAAQSKARTEELTTVLQQQGGQFDAVGEKILAMNVLDGVTNEWDDLFRGVVEMSKSVEESFDILGVSAADVGKKLADPQGRDAYLKGWERISDAMVNGTEITDGMAAAVGTTTEALEGVNRMDLRHVRSAMEGVAEEAEKAEARAKLLGETFGTSSVAGAAMAKNFDTLGSSATTVSDKFSALKQNLDLMNNGVLTATEAESAYHQNLRSTNEALTTLIANNDGVTTGLLGVGGAFDVTTAKGDSLFQTLNTQKDAILQMGVATLQQAMTAGDTLPQAQAKALATMETQTEAMKSHLLSIGFTVPEVDAMLKTLALNPDQLQAALVVDSAQAEVDVARTALAAQAFAQGNYAAALGALPEAARDAILDATGMADEYASGKWEAVLDAVDAGGDDRAAFVSEMLAASGNAEYMAALKARNEAGAGISETRAQIEENMWLGTPFAILETKDNTSIGLNPAKAKMDEWQAYIPPTKPIEVEDQTWPEFSSALDHLSDWEAAQVEAKRLLVEEAYGGDLAAAKADIEAQFGPSAVKYLETGNKASAGIMEATAEVDANWKGLPSMLDLMAQNKAGEGIASATGSVMSEWINNPNNKLGIFTEDQAMPGVISSKSTIENGLAGIAGGSGGLGRGVSVAISAEDLAAYGTASAANTMATGVTDQYRGIFANDGTAVGTASAQGTMNTLQSVYRDLQAFNQTAGATAESQATMNTLQNVMRDLQAQNTTGGPLQASQATMNSLQNVMRDLQAQNVTGGAKNAAQGTMNSLQSVMRDLNANNQVGIPVGNAQSAIDGVTGTEVDIVANDYASGPAENAAAAIGRVVGRTVDVVTNFVSKHFNAEGGFYNGDGEKVFANGGIMKSTNNTAVQAFANGGISRGAQQQAIKAFAGGGTENHTAQIARGAWPVRIWAEPETGGEAYIPLSPNKRKRSLAILKEVMAEFGLEHLTHSFADGGLNKASRAATPTVISSRYAAATTGSVTPTAQPTTQMAAPIINVHPSQGLNEEQIGVIASDRLWFNIQNSSF